MSMKTITLTLGTRELPKGKTFQVEQINFHTHLYNPKKIPTFIKSVRMPSGKNGVVIRQPGKQNILRADSIKTVTVKVPN